MPHKRAKRSVRDANKNEKGFDLAPKPVALNTEGIPKGALRVLQAEAIRAQWREKKRKREDEPDEGAGGKEKKQKITQKVKENESELRLKEGESLGEFNRRVNATMRTRIKAKKPAKPKPSVEESAVVPKARPDRKTDFATLPKTTRLNDIAQAPPTLTKLPRRAEQAVGKKREGVVSMATKVALEQERTKVVELYRTMKEGRRKETVVENDVRW